MTNIPSFPFYPNDWIRDTRALSLAAKGAWIDLIASAWNAQNRGALELPLQGYARLIGATVEQTVAVLTELIDLGILDAYITDGDGAKLCKIPDDVTVRNGKVTVECRRLVREENIRKSGALRASRARNAKSNAKVTSINDLPSSSFSSSSSEDSTSVLSSTNAGVTRQAAKMVRPRASLPHEEKGAEPDYSRGFKSFRAVHPWPDEKVKDAWTIWQLFNLEEQAREICRAIEQQKQWPERAEQNYRFFPRMVSYLQGQRWQDRQPGKAQVAARNIKQCRLCYSNNGERLVHFAEFDEESFLEHADRQKLPFLQFTKLVDAWRAAQTKREKGESEGS